MSGKNILTPEEIDELKNHPIDFSDIPEMTDEQAKLFKPRYFNVKPPTEALTFISTSTYRLGAIIECNYYYTN